jgi:glycosyltransferase involved in cell wall biosynthesis
MMAGATVDATIFIRTKNEARRLPECLAQIAKQASPFTVETIVLDSGSHDETVRIATDWGARVYSIPPSLFTFSRALNFGANVARGRYFIPLSGHAVPVESSWLRELIQPLLEHSEVSASYSRQVAWPEDSVRTREGVSRAFLEADVTVTKSLFEAWCRHGGSPFDAAKFSNVSACILTEEVRAHPFRSLPAAEDRCFAMEALLRGRTIAYASRSVVRHSHGPNFVGQMEIARINSIARRIIDASARDALSLADHSSPLLAMLLAAAKVIAGVPWVAAATLTSSEYRAYAFGEFGTACGKFRASVIPTPSLPPPALPYALASEAVVVSEGR